MRASATSGKIRRPAGCAVSFVSLPEKVSFRDAFSGSRRVILDCVTAGSAVRTQRTGLPDHEETNSKADSGTNSKADSGRSGSRGIGPRGGRRIPVRDFGASRGKSKRVGSIGRHRALQRSRIRAQRRVGAGSQIQDARRIRTDLAALGCVAGVHPGREVGPAFLSPQNGNKQ